MLYNYIYFYSIEYIFILNFWTFELHLLINTDSYQDLLISMKNEYWYYFMCMFGVIVLQLLLCWIISNYIEI